MVRGQETGLSIVRRLIGLFEKMDIDQALTYFTEDAVYRFGNYPPAHGREAIGETTRASHLDQIKNIAFDLQHVWENGDVVVAEMEIKYTLADGTVLTLPCTDIFRIQGGLIRDMRVYMDASPLFNAPNPTSGSKTELVKRLFDMVEHNNLDEYVSYFTDDAVYKAGNLPAAVGPEGIREFAAPVMQMFSRVTHNIHNMWEIGGDTVVCEMDLTYYRNDGQVFTFPCLDIIRLRGDKVCGLQAFIDATPAFS